MIKVMWSQLANRSIRCAKGKHSRYVARQFNHSYLWDVLDDEIDSTVDPTVDNRDEIFAILDSYIAAGWGEVPRVLIEKLEAKNGGVLPDEPPTGYKQGRKPKGFSETMRERMAQQ